MNRMKEALLFALLVTSTGCFGGSSGGDGPPTAGNPPPPPPPSPSPPSLPTASIGGIWVGSLEVELSGHPETRSSQAVRLLVTEDNVFRWILDEADQQFIGNFEVDGTTFTSTYGLFWYEYAQWITTDANYRGSLALSGTVDRRISLTGSFGSFWWTDFAEYAGSFSLTYDPLYERDSSHAMLAGTYTSVDESLTIDDRGALSYESSLNGCTGTGAADLIRTDYNLYSVTVRMDGCTGEDVARNGHSYTGFAYLADSGTDASNDVLELAMSVPTSDDLTPYEDLTEHFVWNLSVRR